MKCSVSRRCATLVLLSGLMAALGQPSACESLSWLSDATIPREKVTAILQSVETMERADVEKFLASLEKPQYRLSSEGEQAVRFLTGAAQEQLGSFQAASKTYQDLSSSAKGTPYSVSADLRLRMLASSKGDRKTEEMNLQGIVGDKDSPCWFRHRNGWRWASSRAAASEELVVRRADDLSFRFFRSVHAKSPFDPPYAYIFVLLVLAAGAKLLEFPLIVKTARFTTGLRILQPQIDAIRNSSTTSAQDKQQNLAALYKSAGVSPFGGCALAFVDLVFVIWVYVALAGFSPQLVLDHARFLWLDDVTQFSFAVGLLWAAVGLGPAAVRQGSLGKTSESAIGAVTAVAIFIGLAWVFSWPAYVLIFWAMLSFIGAVIGKIAQWFIR